MEGVPGSKYKWVGDGGGVYVRVSPFRPPTLHPSARPAQCLGRHKGRQAVFRASCPPIRRSWQWSPLRIFPNPVSVLFPVEIAVGQIEPKSDTSPTLTFRPSQYPTNTRLVEISVGRFLCWSFFVLVLFSVGQIEPKLQYYTILLY